MKHMKFTLSLFLLCFAFLSASAQSEVYGKWKASCFFERADNGSLMSCNLCDMEMIDEGKSMMIQSFDIEFSVGELIITKSGVSEKTDFQWNDKGDVISFAYKGKTYQLKLLQCTNANQKILKVGQENQIILLERILR